MKKAFILFFLFSGLKAFNQQTDSLPYIDISQLQFADTLVDKLAYSFSKNNSWQQDFEKLVFLRATSRSIPVTPDKIPQKAILKFNISNSSDSTRNVFFFPGFFFDKIALYRQTGNRLDKLPDILPRNRDSIGYRMISLSPGDSATLFAEMHCVKTYTSSLRPRLINSIYITSYIVEINHKQDNLDQATYVFAGLLLMMILFSMANYLFGRNRDFLYYSGYAFFLAAMLFTKSYFNQHTSYTNYFFESYLDFILQGIGLIFYMVFMQRFLETRAKYPFIHKLYGAGILVLGSSLCLYSFLHFFSGNYSLEYYVETGSKMVLLVMILVFIIYSLKKWNDRLLRFIVWGNIFLFLFSLISQSFILFKLKINGPPIFNSSLFYYELGLFLELVFFFIGLSYKNRKQIIEQTRERENLKMENERKEFEKQMAVVTAQQDERNRISTDMHDELGSGMTAIRLMSEIAKNKMKENTPREIERISQSADDVLNKMNAIIWSMNSKNDSLGNLISYIRAYAIEYLEGTSVQCKVNIPERIPEKELSGDKRRNLFLCVKETLNNMLKHSKANEITIDITTDEVLVIKIHDYGVGIDFQKLRQFGNGLQNIDRRMASIGGSFKIENDEGTITTLNLPL
jgi:signal transduction histidine kinase